jgi:hypothetical protein
MDGLLTMESQMAGSPARKGVETEHQGQDTQPRESRRWFDSLCCEVMV